MKTRTYSLKLFIAAFVMGATILTPPFAGHAGAATATNVPACQAVLLIGHRGTSVGVARNNSLAAFKRAVADGAEMIEMDIRRTKPVNGSGTWVVWHDATIKGKKITSYTYAQLKAIQPDLMTIREAIAYISTTDRRMEVEVKPASAGEGSFKYFQELVVQYNMQERFQLSSFDTTNLIRAKKYGLKTVYLANTPTAPATARQYATIVHLNKTLVTSKAMVDAYHALGIQVYVYTMNTVTEWSRYLGYGVDGITTNLAATYTRYCNALQV